MRSRSTAPPQRSALSLYAVPCPSRGSQCTHSHPPAALRRSGVRSVAAAPAGLPLFTAPARLRAAPLVSFLPLAGQRITHPAHPGGTLRGGRLRRPAGSSPAGFRFPPAPPPRAPHPALPLGGGAHCRPPRPLLGCWASWEQQNTHHHRPHTRRAVRQKPHTCRDRAGSTARANRQSVRVARRAMLWNIVKHVALYTCHGIHSGQRAAAHGRQHPARQKSKKHNRKGISHLQSGAKTVQ